MGTKCAKENQNVRHAIVIFCKDVTEIAMEMKRYSSQCGTFSETQVKEHKHTI
jgi:hypothetical protein